MKFVARRPLILSLLFALAFACQSCTNAALQVLQSQFDSNPNSPGGSTGGTGGGGKGGGGASAPSNLNYEWTNFVFTQNVQITSVFPYYSGGTPTSYSITPSTLPNGLYLDASTGSIYGQPSGPPQGSTPYTLVATNASGSASYDFNISIEADDSFRSWTNGPTIPTPTTGVAVAPLFFGGSALIIGGSTASIGATAATWIYNGGSINVGPNLNIGRDQMTATVLQNGAILVAGGVDASGTYLASAELYDPSMNIFTLLSSTMSSARGGHTATLLEDGTVLLVGGYNGTSAVTSADIFNPETNQFTPVFGSLNVARYGHAATLMGDGNVLITGGAADGSSTPYSSGEVYDMPTGTFTMLGSTMSSVRANHISVALPNGQVLVALGATTPYGFGGVTSAADIYDPVSQTFTPTGTAYVAAYGPTGILLPNGEVLVVGGAIVGCTPAQASELYDPVTGEWTNTASTPSYAVNGQAGALLTNGEAFIAGGVNYDCGGDPAPQIPNTSYFQ